MLSKEFIDEMRAKLLSEKERLTNDLSETPEHNEMGDDSDDNALEIEVDEVNKDLRERIQSDLEKIEKALMKIENGTYGLDENGVEISVERLRVIPWADEAI